MFGLGSFELAAVIVTTLIFKILPLGIVIYALILLNDIRRSIRRIAEKLSVTESGSNAPQAGAER